MLITSMANTPVATPVPNWLPSRAYDAQVDPFSSVVEPLSIAANCAQIFSTLSAGTIPARSGRASRTQRQQAYLQFGRTVYEAVFSATHLRALASFDQPSSSRLG